MSPHTDLACLADLCGLRTSPTLDGPQRDRIRLELEERVAACAWFTVGVMAPSQAAALAALRRFERALGWKELVSEDVLAVSGPVFLKGNQSSGLFRVRAETGLGEGMLITGHQPADPGAEATWGPLPLDFYP